MDWGLLILVIDAVSDVEQAEDEYCEKLNVVCFKLLFEKLAEANQVYEKEFVSSITLILKHSLHDIEKFNPVTPLSSISIFLAKRIKRKMNWVSPVNKKVPLEITLRAIRECAILCKGQIDSFKQKKCDDLHDIDWYCDNVLYNKTIYIYSFIYLFPQTELEGLDAIKLGDALLTVNDMYLNRQLLDDLNDIEIDTHDGIYAGPSYILCNKFGKQKHNSPLSNYLVSEVMKRNVTAPYLDQNAELFGRYLKTSPSKAIQALFESGIPNALIEMIEDEHRYQNSYKNLLNTLQDNPKTKLLATLFYYRCGKSLLKAKALIQKNTTISTNEKENHIVTSC